jgi:hypothetical protein
MAGVRSSLGIRSGKAFGPGKKAFGRAAAAVLARRSRPVRSLRQELAMSGYETCS